MDPLQHVRAGEPMEIGADTWNLLLDTAKAIRAGRGGPPSGRAASFPVHPSLTCLVKYDESSVETLDALSVVTLGDSLVALSGDDGDPHGVNRRPGYTIAGAPATASDVVAVTLEPIVGQQLGRAVVSGQVVCLVDVSDADHTRAVPIPGDTDKMESADSGGYPILYKESGTGEVYAVVLLGANAGELVYAESQFYSGGSGYTSSDGTGVSSGWTIDLPTAGVYLLAWDASVGATGASGDALRVRGRWEKTAGAGGSLVSDYGTCFKDNKLATSGSRTYWEQSSHSDVIVVAGPVTIELVWYFAHNTDFLASDIPGGATVQIDGDGTRVTAVRLAGFGAAGGTGLTGTYGG